MTSGGQLSADPPTTHQRVSLETLHRQLRDAIEAIETGEQWQAWLDVAHRLHSYSFNNQILILSQLPTASQVASYTTWQAINRQVRRGEHALRVLAPTIRRVKVVDDNGRPLVDDNGTERTRQKITGFRPVPVFDISQTDGPPLPTPQEPTLLAGDAPAGLWDALAGEVAARGYRLLRGAADDLDGANGRTHLGAREVVIRDDLADAQAAKTLAHELAHVLLHAVDGYAGDCRGIIEVEAESVAHLVMASHHVDTGSYSFPYVAAWAYPIAAVEHVPLADIVTRTGQRVMNAADQIIAATTPAERPPETHTVALAARVAASTRDTAELREQTQAAALPPVDRDVLLGVVADSHDFYRRQVAGSWVPGYLAQRHLDPAITTHGIGYAPAGWTALTDHLRRLGYTDDHIEAAGMATRSRDGQLIDRMRDRLLIPLHDPNGDCVGFSGRIAPTSAGGNAPKYLNTPTTSIYVKSNLLYGLAPKGTVARAGMPVVCEGPLDAIAIDLLAADLDLAMHGISACGTAFTQVHGITLVDAARGQTICLALDGDAAGAKATETTWRTIAEAGGRHVTVAPLPERADPASVYAGDPARLAWLITEARPAGMVIAERRMDAARLDGHVGREIAAFRDLVVLGDLMAKEDRVPYALLLADRLHVAPDLAASLIAEINPDLLADRVLAHCKNLSQQIDVGLAGGHARTDSPEAQGREQPAITSSH